MEKLIRQIQSFVSGLKMKLNAVNFTENQPKPKPFTPGYWALA